MAVKFLADENFDHKTLAGLLRRQPDLDIVTVQAAGLRELDDPTVLDWAAREQRVVVTHDVATFADFAFERVEIGLAMPGVIVIPASVPRLTIIEELIFMAAASEPEDWQNAVRYLPLR